MAGSIFELAKKDSRHFVTKGGFEENITLETPSSDLIVNITGLATKHHINFDSDGLPINSKNVHINISETDLVELSYPVRNAKGEIALKGHFVVFKDSSGLDRNYKVNETYPDESLGLIVCILSDRII